MDKISTIKRLINRNSYYLDSRQIGQIHKAFQDMYLQKTTGGDFQTEESPPRGDHQDQAEQFYTKPVPSLHSQAQTNRSARPWQGKRPSSRAGNIRNESAGRIDSRSGSNTSRNDFSTMQPNDRSRGDGMIPQIRPSSRNRGMPSPARGNFGIVAN